MIFPECFPWVIEFCIVLLLQTNPISVPPYQIARAKLKELNFQLNDLLDKGCIDQVFSIWCSGIVFE